MASKPVTIFHLEIPLRSPFSTSGGSVGSRSIALVRVGDGPYGWGEAAPFPGQDEPISDVLQAAQVGESTPTLDAAIDEARADLQERSRGESLAQIAGATKTVLDVSLAVGLTAPMIEVERAVEEGISRFKLKIEPGRVGHVAEIRRSHPDVLLGLDANGSFALDTVSELEALLDLDIAYVEQPVLDMASAAAVQICSTIATPVFADESVRSVADAEALLSLEHVDGVVIKPGRLGWTGAIAVRDRANAAGKLWRASGLLETGIGRAYADILAACPDAFVSDVAPADWFLETDVTASRYADAQITVPSAPGLGVTPFPDLL
jgi:L-alanine-DL-glutamate epimerase-like enolase superfamily enzyme